MATIEERGPYQFRVRVRRQGRSVSKTFTSKVEAQKWAREEEGRVTGDEYVDRRLSKRTSLAAALEYYEQISFKRSKPNAKNVRSKLKYWYASEFAKWSIVSIKPSDLIEWRKGVLDEANAPEGENCGPDAECSPQTVIHRLITLSQVYKCWRANQDSNVLNPVIETVRPSLANERDRRIQVAEERKLLQAAARSSRKWLKAAIIVSLETAMRQAELAGLEWRRVHLDGSHPFVSLPPHVTKTKRARRVPLSSRAVKAFKSLKQADARPSDRVFPVETPRAFGHAWRGVVKEEVFPDLRWHDMRHEATSRFFEHTYLREHEIMAITGHQRAESLKRYLHLRADQFAGELDAKQRKHDVKRRGREKRRANASWQVAEQRIAPS